MTVHLSPIFLDAQFDANGAALSGGKLYWYLTGTLTPATTYADSAGVYPNPNPIILNSRGEPPQPIWLTDGVTYKAQLNDSLDVAVRPAIDGITGVNAVSSTTTGIEWTASGLTPTYISTIQFSVTGDQTSILVVSRRLKVTVSTGSIYGTITASSYAAGFTTVTFSGDSVALDASISAFSYGTLSPVNSSIPKNYTDGWGGTAGGTADVLTISVIPALGAYAAGQNFRFIPALTNATTTPTLNVNGLGAKTIKSRSIGGLTTVAVGAIYAGQEMSVTYDGTYFVIDVASSVAGSQTFTANGTFTVPSCNFVRVVAIGPGGGGGSGARNAAGTVRGGGGGGGGGERREQIFSVSELGGIGAAIAVIVPTGGLGGPGRGIDNASGVPGGGNGDTSFGSLLIAIGGLGGAGGGLGGSSGGNGGHYNTTGVFGGAGGVSLVGSKGYWGGGGGGGSDATSTVGYAGGDSEYGCGGGGGGGGINAANASQNGGGGGYVGPYGSTGGGAAGIGAAGGSGSNFAGLDTAGGGGGGAAGFAGGTGGTPGGGGGGGGATLNGTVSGAGANGGRGEVRVYWW